MKQTAVEFFEHELKDKLGTIVINKNWELLEQIIDQAKAMEKEQMDKACGDWWNEGASYMYDGKRKYETFEQYYNETFKSE